MSRKPWGIAEWSALIGAIAAILGILSWFGVKASGSNTDEPSPPVNTQTRAAPAGTGSAKATDSGPTRDAYTAAADRVCLKWFAVTGQVDASTAPGSLERFQGELNALRSMLIEWKALPPPKGDEREIGAILDLYGQAADSMEQAYEALAAGDPAAAQQHIAASDQPNREAARRARSYGLRACGEST